MGNWVDYAELKTRIKIEQVADMLGLVMKPSAGKLRGPCHACKAGGDRALVITPEKGVFYCFAGKTGGDQIAMAAHILGCTANEAAQRINNHFGGKPQVASQPPKPKEQEGTKTLTPLAYLQAEHEAVQALGIEKDTAEAWGAGFSPKGIMRGRFAVPIKSPTGVLLAYVGIALTDEQSPRLHLPNGFDGRLIVFGAHRLSENIEFRLAADPLEVLMIDQQAGEVAVCFLTETICGEQLAVLDTLMTEAKTDLIP